MYNPTSENDFGLKGVQGCNVVDWYGGLGLLLWMVVHLSEMGNEWRIHFAFELFYISVLFTLTQVGLVQYNMGIRVVIVQFEKIKIEGVFSDTFWPK